MPMELLHISPSDCPCLKDLVFSRLLVHVYVSLIESVVWMESEVPFGLVMRLAVG